MKEAKERVRRKLPQGKIGYIAYFQAFTNTYGTVEELEPMFMEAVRDPEVWILSIATRPDCLPPDILDMLERINQRKPVWVELGLQTIHPQTAAYIRRGYELPVYEQAVKELKQRGLEIVTHVILGLPGESTADMVQTVEYVGQTGADASCVRRYGSGGRISGRTGRTSGTGCVYRYSGTVCQTPAGTDRDSSPDRRRR